MYPIDGITVPNISVRRIFVCAVFGKFLYFLFIFFVITHFVSLIHFNVYYLLRFLHRFWLLFFRLHVFFFSLSFVLFSFLFLSFFVSRSCNSLGSKLYHRHRHAISIVTTSFRIGCIFWSGLLVYRCNLFRIVLNKMLWVENRIQLIK